MAAHPRRSLEAPARSGRRCERPSRRRPDLEVIDLEAPADSFTVPSAAIDAHFRERHDHLWRAIVAVADDEVPPTTSVLGLEWSVPSCTSAETRPDLRDAAGKATLWLPPWTSNMSACPETSMRWNDGSASVTAGSRAALNSARGRYCRRLPTTARSRSAARRGRRGKDDDRQGVAAHGVPEGGGDICPAHWMRRPGPADSRRLRGGQETDVAVPGLDFFAGVVGVGHQADSVSGPGSSPNAFESPRRRCA